MDKRQWKFRSKKQRNYSENLRIKTETTTKNIENVPRDKNRDRDKVEGQLRICLSKMSLRTQTK